MIAIYYNICLKFQRKIKQIIIICLMDNKYCFFEKELKDTNMFYKESSLKNIPNNLKYNNISNSNTFNYDNLEYVFDTFNNKINEKELMLENYAYNFDLDNDNYFLNLNENVSFNSQLIEEDIINETNQNDDTIQTISTTYTYKFKKPSCLSNNNLEIQNTENINQINNNIENTRDTQIFLNNVTINNNNTNINYTEINESLTNINFYNNPLFNNNIEKYLKNNDISKGNNLNYNVFTKDENIYKVIINNNIRDHLLESYKLKFNKNIIDYSVYFITVLMHKIIFNRKQHLKNKLIRKNFCVELTESYKQIINSNIIKIDKNSNKKNIQDNKTISLLKQANIRKRIKNYFHKSIIRLLNCLLILITENRNAFQFKQIISYSDPHIRNNKDLLKYKLIDLLKKDALNFTNNFFNNEFYLKILNGNNFEAFIVDNYIFDNSKQWNVNLLIAKDIKKLAFQLVHFFLNQTYEYLLDNFVKSTLFNSIYLKNISKYYSDEFVSEFNYYSKNFICYVKKHNI